MSTIVYDGGRSRNVKTLKTPLRDPPPTVGQIIRFYAMNIWKQKHEWYYIEAQIHKKYYYCIVNLLSIDFL